MTSKGKVIDDLRRGKAWLEAPPENPCGAVYELANTIGKAIELLKQDTVYVIVADTNRSGSGNIKGIHRTREGAEDHLKMLEEGASGMYYIEYGIEETKLEQ